MKKITKWVGRRISVLRGCDFPIDKIIGKSFMSPSKLPHQDLLIKYETFGRDGFDWKDSAYFNRIVSNLGNPSRSFDTLPSGLDIEASWWVMPWGCYPAKENKNPMGLVEKKALRKINGFFDLYESIKNNGYSAAKGGAISGYILVHPVYGEIFNQIDGHHRLAILDFLSKQGRLQSDLVRVLPLDRINRSELFHKSACREGLEKEWFTKSDALALFDHPFQQLGFKDVGDWVGGLE